MFQNRLHTEKGSITVDLIMAMSLGVFFIYVIGNYIQEIDKVFAYTKERKTLLDIYEQSGKIAFLPPDTSTTHLSQTSSTSPPIPVQFASQRFGNFEKMMSIRIGSTMPILFTKIEKSNSLDTLSSEQICSPRLDAVGVVGGPYLPAYINIKKISLPINVLPLTDIVVQDNVFYVSTDSNFMSDPDLFIIDASTSTPILLSALNTGPGLSAIAIGPKKLYAANRSTVSQLQVIDIKNKASPYVEYSYSFDLPYATATAPYASAIFYRKDRVYMGSEKWVGHELQIMDVHSGPTGISSYEIGSKVNALYVYGKNLYIAASDEKQLRVLDIDQSPPVLINTFSPSGFERQEGKTISYFEDELDFGRTSGGFDISTDYELFHWGTSTLESLLSPSFLNEKGGIYGIQRTKDHVFVATREVGKELLILPAHHIEIGYATSSSLPVSVQKITCSGRNIYLLAKNQPVVYEISFK